MRIAIVTETWPPEVNGVELTVQALVRGLIAQGHAVELVRPRTDSEPIVTPWTFDEVLVRGAGLPRYPGLHFGLPAPNLLRRHWQIERPDALYVATEGPLGLTALGAARRLHIPASTGFHTRFDEFARYYGLALSVRWCWRTYVASTDAPLQLWYPLRNWRRFWNATVSVTCACCAVRSTPPCSIHNAATRHCVDSGDWRRMIWPSCM